MTDTEVSTESFGKLIRAGLGAGPGRSTLTRQRALIVEGASSIDKPRSFQGSLGWALAAAGAVLAVAAYLFVTNWHGQETALSATFSGQNVLEQASIEAHAARPETLSFSDGSSIVLDPRTRAELSRLEPKRADLRLEEGRILASIQKRTGAIWTIAVGPYSVRVVGTRFSVDWDRESRVLKVEVREGRVLVFGGDLLGDGVALDAGGRLERRYGAAEAAPGSEAASNEPAGIELKAEAAAPPARVAANAPAANPTSAEPTWLELANKGKYREALALAEQRGFAALAGELPENDLLVLANTARFSGDAARARQALLKLRQRFPGRPAAELAALYLARVAEDLEKRPAETARWLRVFLSESPTGDLAAGARVNLMSILLRSGDQAGARAIAADYLRYNPNGPHATQARSLIEQTPSR